MEGLKVQTYQIARQNITSNGNTTDAPDLSDINSRLNRLENNQFNINNEYYCDFSKDEHINSLSTIINTGSGIIPRQYSDLYYCDFSIDDTMIDWEKSKNLALYNGKAGINVLATRYAELFTTPIPLKEYIGFRLNANVNMPTVESLEGQEELANGNLAFSQAVDNYGRLWVLRWSPYRTETITPGYLTIYNKDMSIYKESVVDSAMFQTVTNAADYTIATETVNMIFSDENLCILGYISILGNRNGYSPHSTSEKQVIHYIVAFLDEDGNYKVKYTHIVKPSSNNTNSVSNVDTNYTFLDKCSLWIYKNVVCFESPSCLRLYTYDTYSYERVFFSLKTISGRLSTVNEATSLVETKNNYYQTYSRINQNFFGFSLCSQIQKIDNTIHRLYCNPIPLNNIYDGSKNKVFINIKTLNEQTQKVQSEVFYYLHSISGGKANIGFNNLFYDAKNQILYVFCNNNDKAINIDKYKIEFTSTNIGISHIAPGFIDSYPSMYIADMTLMKSFSISSTSKPAYLDSSWSLIANMKKINEFLKIIDDGTKLNLLYISYDDYGKQILNYLSVDYDLNVITPITSIHCSDGNAKNDVVHYDMVCMEDKNMILYSMGDKEDFTDAASDNNNIYTANTISHSSNIRFYYSTNNDLIWKPIELEKDVVLQSPANDIRIKAILESNNLYNDTPTVSSLYIETWDNDNNISRQSEYISNRIDSIQNEGKAVLTADYDLNEGSIDWYVSYDGGNTYNKVELNTEFVYTHLSVPDFRVKAVLSTTDNATKLPIVRSYTLKSTHVALHSDLEKIQINLMITNFKIDTLAKASRNGLFKMFIDTFSDNKGIDTDNSDCMFYPYDGTVGGNYVITKPQEIESSSTAILITSSEVLDETNPNCRINYFVSLDGGVLYKPIRPNERIQLSNTNNTKNEIKVKMVFYEGARITALGVAWD